jgi:hypothetical protein
MVQSYDLVETGKYHIEIRRGDGSLVFKLARKDKRYAEQILDNLVNGRAADDEDGQS